MPSADTPKTLSSTMRHELIDRSPARYRVECDYNTLGPDGKIVATNRYAGAYESDAKPGELEWSSVTRNGTPQAFMNGFRYARSADPTVPTFFEGFPSTAVECRNLVWDVRMVEHFAEDYQDDLVLNEPLQIDDASTSPLVSGSPSTNRIDLTWLANAEWKGQGCALIRYRSFFNRYDTELGPMRFKGTSQFWGGIWVSFETRRIEYATLYECVTVLLGRTTPVSIVREATFERV